MVKLRKYISKNETNTDTGELKKIFYKLSNPKDVSPLSKENEERVLEFKDSLPFKQIVFDDFYDGITSWKGKFTQNNMYTRFPVLYILSKKTDVNFKGIDISIIKQLYHNLSLKSLVYDLRNNYITPDMSHAQNTISFSLIDHYAINRQPYANKRVTITLDAAPIINLGGYFCPHCYGLSYAEIRVDHSIHDILQYITKIRILKNRYDIEYASLDKKDKDFIDDFLLHDSECLVNFV